jgi:hypothetical protein
VTCDDAVKFLRDVAVYADRTEPEYNVLTDDVFQELGFGPANGVALMEAEGAEFVIAVDPDRAKNRDLANQLAVLLNTLSAIGEVQ